MSFIIRVACKVCGRTYTFPSDSRTDTCPLCGEKQ